jgi:hypothetical protein
MECIDSEVIQLQLFSPSQIELTFLRLLTRTAKNIQTKGRGR